MTRGRISVVSGMIALLVMAAILGSHRSYSPGPLLKGHATFGNDCSSCHDPWRGVAISGSACVDCHGATPKNPHSATRISDASSGVVAGRSIAGFRDRLACMSCHTDHVGRAPNMAAVSGGNCAWCHQHDSIENVSAHRRKPMLLIGSPVQIFAKPFSHQQHLQDAIDHLEKARKRAQTMRSEQRRKEAEKEVAALVALLSPSGQDLQCAACHVVEPWRPGRRDRFAFAIGGCVVAGCHASWHEPEMLLTDAAPQYAQQQVPVSPDPLLIDYVDSRRFQFVKAVFEHSEGHLRSPCSECHSEIQKSAKPGDFRAKHVANCFTCHAHQPASAKTGQAAGPAPASFAIGSALAARQPRDREVTGCADCHLFHVNFHGADRVSDFSGTAPVARPHPVPSFALGGYAIRLSFRDARPQFQVAATRWRPWWSAIAAILMAIGALLAYVRYAPAQPEVRLTRGNVAPQRTAEVPLLDDSYQSSVSGLYVIGETAGTASINLAMRSGRQAIEFAASALGGIKAEPRPDLYDVAIVGCGPAGIGAATTAKARGLSYIALEKTTAASTIRNYPRGKFVQSTPIEISEYGSFMMEGDTSKEGLVRKWEEMLAKTGIAVREREEVVGVRRESDFFRVSTASGNTFLARFVILAIGVRGSPRRLNLPGETPDRVFYNLIEPEEFRDKRILVVGGGNAGAEVTQALAAPELHNLVSYSFRATNLGPPVTRENADKIAALQQERLITVYPSSQVAEIAQGRVTLAPIRGRGGPQLTAGPGAVVLTEPIQLENDVVFAMLGAEAPANLLKSFGIRMVKKGR